LTGFESVVGINPWTALFTFCNMIITFLILKKFLFAPVKRMIDDRQKEIDDLYARAEDAQKQAEAHREAYAKKLSEAQTEAGELLFRATADAREKGETIVQNAREEADGLMERAREEIRLEEKRSVNRMKDEISSLAVAIAAKVTEKELREADHTALVEKFIEELGEPS